MADALLNTQLPSGYDEEFVNEVDDDFLCLICQLPLREPVQCKQYAVTDFAKHASRNI